MASQASVPVQQSPGTGYSVGKKIKHICKAFRALWIGDADSEKKSTRGGHDETQPVATVQEVCEAQPHHRHDVDQQRRRRQTFNGTTSGMPAPTHELRGIKHHNHRHSEVQVASQRNVAGSSANSTIPTNMSTHSRATEAPHGRVSHNSSRRLALHLTASEPALRSRRQSSATRSASAQIGQDTWRPAYSTYLTPRTWQTRSRQPTAERVHSLASIPEQTSRRHLVAAPEYNEAPHSSTLGTGVVRRSLPVVCYYGQHFSSPPTARPVIRRSVTFSTSAAARLNQRSDCKPVWTPSIAPSTSEVAVEHAQDEQSIYGVPSLASATVAGSFTSRRQPARYRSQRPDTGSVVSAPPSHGPIPSHLSLRPAIGQAAGNPSDETSSNSGTRLRPMMRSSVSSAERRTTTPHSSPTSSLEVTATVAPLDERVVTAPAAQVDPTRDSSLAGFIWPWQYRTTSEFEKATGEQRASSPTSNGRASFVTAAQVENNDNSDEEDEKERQDSIVHDTYYCHCTECFQWRMRYRFEHYAIGQRLRDLEALQVTLGDSLQRAFQSPDSEYTKQFIDLKETAVALKRLTPTQSNSNEDREFISFVDRLMELETEVKVANNLLEKALRELGEQHSRSKREDVAVETGASRSSCK